jgi:hypothetical protein
MRIGRDDVAKLRENDPRTPIAQEAEQTASPSWLEGQPMDPLATPAEPVPCLPGVPFAYAGAAALVVGPTGGGRSSLVQAALYDAARAGLRCAYLGSEITAEEFNARAAGIATARGDGLDDELRQELGAVRYLDLFETIAKAWSEPEVWIAGASAYAVLAIDPVSAVASALSLDFDKSNDDWVRFFDRLIQPVTAAGVTTLLIDNVGHAEEAKRRAKGASAKSDRADLTFSCALSAEPPGLLLRAHKVRSIRAGFGRGDEWLFAQDTQRIEQRDTASGAGEFRPTRLMQRTSEVIEQAPGLSRNAIRAAVKGRSEHVSLALQLLISESYVSKQHTSIKPYREPPFPVSQPFPTVSPETPRDTPVTRFPVSAHLSAGNGNGPGSPGHTPESLIAAVSHGDISDEDAEREWERLEAGQVSA